jgi:hypothetical protein
LLRDGRCAKAYGFQADDFLASRRPSLVRSKYEGVRLLQHRKNGDNHFSGAAFCANAFIQKAYRNANLIKLFDQLNDIGGLIWQAVETGSSDYGATA